jgi:signal transduction histidine kinase
MIAYGVHHQLYLEMRLAEHEHEAQRSAGAQRQRMLDAERADREKSEILSIISHELRTPLTAARGLIDLALRAMDRDQPERARTSMTSARQALDRMARLSGDLVAASRGEAAPMQFSRQDVAALLTQACEWSATLAAQKDIALERELPSDPVSVCGNADALLSVFGNLLSNAIRYTDEGGTVMVRCGREDGGVWVSVSDTGIGMAPGVAARIFDKFYRSPEAKAHEASGLGLGLSLARQIVVAHGGTISVNSTEGQGSTFRIGLPPTLPVCEEDTSG